VYDPSVGRWLSEDPAGFGAGDANLFRYVGNDPTNDSDPSGLAKDINDAEWEKDEGLTDDLKPGGRMKQDDKYLNGGKAFVATNCLGVAGVNAEFKFEKAYAGIHRRKAQNVDVQGVYVKLSITLNQENLAQKFTQLRIIQVVRAYTMAGGENSAVFWGQYQKDLRAATRDRKAPSWGWGVDRDSADTNPFFDEGPSGVAGGVGKTAFLIDAPSLPATNAEIGMEFYTCLIGIDACGHAVPVAYVHWGWYAKQAEKPMFLPATPEAKAGYPQELKDAVDRWNKIEGEGYDKVDIDFRKK
jgi:hypothetical protein